MTAGGGPYETLQLEAFHPSDTSSAKEPLVIVRIVDIYVSVLSTYEYMYIVEQHRV
jgi:hypothetical protein